MNAGSFLQIDPTSFLPFNDAPHYLTGRVESDDGDSLHVQGVAKAHMQAWHSLGGRTEELIAHSFSFSVSAMASQPRGACSIGVVGPAGVPKINISHFIKSSVTLKEPTFFGNFYSGFGHNNADERTQTGLPASWEATGRHHNFSIEYLMEPGELTCFANGHRVHQVHGRLQRFSLEVLVQVVGVEGEFDYIFENLYYRPIDKAPENNIRILKAWDPQYPPVFVSYSHQDSGVVSGIISYLRTHRVRILGDWDLGVGDSLRQKLGDFISRAGYVLVILSPASVASRWVKSELEQALQEELDSARGKKIIPVLIQTCDLPNFLKGRLYVDLRQQKTQELGKLLTTIRGLGRW